jgi:hypothetical protein
MSLISTIRGNAGGGERGGTRETLGVLLGLWASDLVPLSSASSPRHFPNAVPMQVTFYERYGGCSLDLPGHTLVLVDAGVGRHLLLGCWS